MAEQFWAAPTEELVGLALWSARAYSKLDPKPYRPSDRTGIAVAWRSG